MIGVLSHYKIKGFSMIIMIFNSIVWWLNTQSIPDTYFSLPTMDGPYASVSYIDGSIVSLSLSLFFLYGLLLNGILQPLAEIADMPRAIKNYDKDPAVVVFKDGAIVLFVSALCTMLSGVLGGPPVILCGDSVHAIACGSRTGLSSCVAGILYIFSIFAVPLLSSVPTSATSSIVIASGAILFRQVLKIDWNNTSSLFGAFTTLLFVPFSAVLGGTAAGWVVFLIISALTGELYLLFQVSMIKLHPRSLKYFLLFEEYIFLPLGFSTPLLNCEKEIAAVTNLDLRMSLPTKSELKSDNLDLYSTVYEDTTPYFLSFACLSQAQNIEVEKTVKMKRSSSSTKSTVTSSGKIAHPLKDIRNSLVKAAFRHSVQLNSFKRLSGDFENLNTVQDRNGFRRVYFEDEVEQNQESNMLSTKDEEGMTPSLRSIDSISIKVGSSEVVVE